MSAPGQQGRRVASALGAALALGAVVPLAAAAAPEAHVVRVAPGHVGDVVREVEARGLEIARRDGSLVQVHAEPGAVAWLGNDPRVASVDGAAPAFPDQDEDEDGSVVRSQGLLRSGATAFLESAGGGSGLRIAVLDLGFGRSVGRYQALGELPPDSRLISRSFDGLAGLAGTNAYGNPTNHGELVAQTVYDYAPDASYVFANYRTQLDFDAAVNWLISQDPDIVVHSNSLLEGPFDGTGPYARAVDRAAASGILWFNSAGNYAQRHWEGGFSDPQGDGVHDWPHPGGWVFFRPRGKPISFALSWSSPAGAVADLDMALETLEPGNVWRPVAESTRSQADGAPSSERITGYTGPDRGFYRLRVWRRSGPAPVGNMTLFSREIPTSPIGGSTVSSQPTPGDARGAISVGAVDWRGDVLKDYSSNGPTDDGRIKPDMVAPTNTRVAGPRGVRAVGGTSNAAPNAAGAAAVLMGRLRARGIQVTPGQVRALMAENAIDLGDEGPDNLFGAGRVRIDTALPRITRISPRPRSDVSGVVKVTFDLSDGSPLAGWSYFRDGEQVGRERKSTKRTQVRVDTRRLEDGWHLLGLRARDWPGNVRDREWPVRVDNTAPTLRVGRIDLRPVGGRSAARAAVFARDAITTGKLALTAEIARADGTRDVIARRRIRRGSSTVGIGTFAPGTYEVVITVTDRAGNTRSVRRALSVPRRGGAAN